MFKWMTKMMMIIIIDDNNNSNTNNIKWLTIVDLDMYASKGVDW